MEWVFLQNGVQVIFMNLDIYIYINNFDIYKKKSNCEIVYVPFEIIGMAYFRLEYLIWLGVAKYCHSVIATISNPSYSHT